MKRLPLVILCGLLLSGSSPQLPNNGVLEREMQSLTDRGLHVQLLGEVVEATDPVSGETWLFSTKMLIPREPTYLGLPTLTIDLRTLDTSLYNWKYHYVNSFPLSSEWGFPLQLGDFDRNGRPEAYGIYQTQSEYLTRIYERLQDITWGFRYSYPGHPGIPNKRGDLDSDSLLELFASANDTLTTFTQLATGSLPTIVKFKFKQWHFGATGIPNELVDIDNDGKVELVYRGTEPDSQTTNVAKTYVARYDSTVNNLMRIWSKQLPPGCFDNNCTGNISPGEFDGDGRREFVTSSFTGNAYVVEHVAGDSFAVTWQDSLSVAGRVAAGDVDGNGIEEFFVGGNQLENDGQVHLRAYVLTCPQFMYQLEC